MRTWNTSDPFRSSHKCFPLSLIPGERFQDLMYLHCRPTLLGGDTPAVGLFAPNSDEPFAWLSAETDDDGDIELQFGCNYGDAIGFFTQMATREQTAYIGLRAFMRVLPDVFECIFERNEGMSDEDYIRAVMISCLPISGSEVLGQLEGVYPATILRDMANAIGVQPASIKKADVADALAACRKDFDQQQPIASRIDITELGHSYVAMQFDSNTEKWTKVVYYARASEARPHTGGVDQRFYARPACNENGLTDYIESACLGQVSNLQSAGVACGDVLRAKDAYFNMYQRQLHHTSSLSKEIADLADLVQKNESKVKQLVASLKASTPQPLPTAGGTISIMGDDFPYYGHADAPKPIDGYTIEYWRASQRLGSGADKVDFTAPDLIDAMIHDGVVSLVGPPGVGKTTIIQQIGHLVGAPVTVVQFTRDKPIEQLIGVDKIRGGSQVFVDGEITVALRHAASNPDVPHFVVFDEFDHAPSEIQSDFHGVVEGRDYTLPSGEVIPNRGNLRFILTRNTTGHGDGNGRHASANISDSAFNSRIKSAFMVDYMEQSEEAILLAANGLDLHEADQLVAFANRTRDSVKSMDSGESYDGMSEPVCLRHLLSYSAARSRGVNKRKALAQCIISQLPERDREAANEMVVACITI